MAITSADVTSIVSTQSGSSRSGYKYKYTMYKDTAQGVDLYLIYRENPTRYTYEVTLRNGTVLYELDVPNITIARRGSNRLVMGLTDAEKTSIVNAYNASLDDETERREEQESGDYTSEDFVEESGQNYFTQWDCRENMEIIVEASTMPDLVREASGVSISAFKGVRIVLFVCNREVRRDGVVSTETKYQVKVYDLEGKELDSKDFTDADAATGYMAELRDYYTEYREALDEQIAQVQEDLGETYEIEHRGYKLRYSGERDTFVWIRPNGEESLMGSSFTTNGVGKDGYRDNYTISDTMTQEQVKEAFDAIVDYILDGAEIDSSVPIQNWGWYLNNTPTDDVRNPFSEFDTIGAVEATDGDTGERFLMLNDTETFLSLSGALKFVVKEGYTVKMDITCENFGWLHQHIDGLSVDGIYAAGGEMVSSNERIRPVRKGRTETFSGSTVASMRENISKSDTIEVTFTGGDELQVDIDDERTGYAQWKLVVDGENVADVGTFTVNDEMYFQITSIDYVAPYVPPEEPPVEPPVEPPTDETGGFDIDGRTILIVGGLLIGVMVVFALATRRW